MTEKKSCEGCYYRYTEPCEVCNDYDTWTKPPTESSDPTHGKMMSAQDCRNKIARNNNFDSFDKAIRYTFNRALLPSEKDFINKIINESMERYAAYVSEIARKEGFEAGCRMQAELDRDTENAPYTSIDDLYEDYRKGAK